jgi:L-alanine-DL-glutamate epimerase-like enolase superfamily enzyme
MYERGKRGRRRSRNITPSGSCAHRTHFVKIESITTRVVRLPLARPLSTATITASDTWFLLLAVRTADGVAGDAYIWSYNAHLSRCLQAMVGELSRHAIGRDARHVPAIWAAMWKGTVQWGHAGITVMATAAIDLALWDALARGAGRSVGQLLGLRTSRVPGYMSGLWIGQDPGALQREAAEYLEQGFRAVKMRVGRPRLEDDVAAVRAVREAIGPGTGLMVDFSSAPSADRAERLALALEDFDLLWIEDPIVDEHPEEHAALARRLRTPVCFGEKVYTPQGFLRLVETRACDHLMADLQRAGGVTGWQRIAALADAARLPLSSHILPELNVHLVASAPTGAWLEYLPWAEDLLQDRLELADGHFAVPDRPGFGLRYDEDRVRAGLQDAQTFGAA